MSQRADLVVYTVLTGSKERLGNPFAANCTGFERICFTDDSALRSSDWSIIVMPSPTLDPGRESRRPKILAHRFLPEFEWSLYIDNSVRLKGNPLDVYRQYASPDSRLVCFRHPWRDCIYAEGEAVIGAGQDSEAHVRAQLDYYRGQGCPEHVGLIAGTVLLRRHRDEALVRLSEEWFDHVRRFSKRDQLSFNYVAWRQGFSYSHFAGELAANEIMDWPVREHNR